MRFHMLGFYTILVHYSIFRLGTTILVYETLHTTHFCRMRIRFSPFSRLSSISLRVLRRHKKHCGSGKSKATPRQTQIYTFFGKKPSNVCTKSWKNLNLLKILCLSHILVCWWHIKKSFALHFLQKTLKTNEYLTFKSAGLIPKIH